LSHNLIIVWALVRIHFSGVAKIKDFTCFALFLLSSKRLPARFIFIKVFVDC